VVVDTPNWLSAREAHAWRGYRRMRALLDLQLARDLARDSGLSEADYDVLSGAVPWSSSRRPGYARSRRPRPGTLPPSGGT
jgi:hypothetical protein